MHSILVSSNALSHSECIVLWPVGIKKCVQIKKCFGRAVFSFCSPRPTWMVDGKEWIWTAHRTEQNTSVIPSVSPSSVPVHQPRWFYSTVSWTIELFDHQHLYLDIPFSVSPYRLATHLIAATILFSSLIWTSLGILLPPSAIHLSHLSCTAALNARKVAAFLFPFAPMTFISGAFVAGNDAGYSYNTWPKMLDRWGRLQNWNWTNQWLNQSFNLSPTRQCLRRDEYLLTSPSSSDA